MKIVIKLILLFLICNFFIPLLPAQAAIDGHLRIITPNGGETYTEGDVVTIKWDASSNIDKIMLGWSTGPGSLNWIATSMPNTGSYTWKVDVGNTTRTSFLIDITGYETGKGSLSDKSDGYFTVNQKSEYPPAPEPMPEPKPEPLPTPEPKPVTTQQPASNPAPQNTTINIQQTTIVSITQIEINQNYYFEGSKSTNLSKIDPAHVDNFTLDRIDLMYFSFLGETDLSTNNAVETFEELDDMVYMDYFYFWFSWEFWILFDTDVEATFYDTAKTIPADAPVTINDQKLAPDEYKIAINDSGEKKVTIAPEVINKYVKEGEKVKIAIKPSLEVNIQPEQKITVDNNKFVLQGSVSDAKAKVIASFNGEKIELFIEEDSTFSKTLNLDQGNNAIKILAYNQAEEEPFSEIEGIIEYQPAQESPINSKTIIVLIIAVIIIAGAGFWFTKQKK